MSEGRGGAGTGPVVRLDRRLKRDGSFDLAADVAAGLTARPKTLPPKYFYDARGSELFEEITRQPEYYLTRAERSILERSAGEIVEEARPRALVEYGSGSATKTRLLLDAMRETGRLEAYGSVDVSAEACRRAAEALAADYPDLELHGVIADFETPLTLPFADRPRLIAFLGSTIGNFAPLQATLFLRGVRRQMRPSDAFLIGFDLVKDPERLERAYDDGAGVTAEFNRNVLRVINRELDAEFDLSTFVHRAFFDPAEARIEMHLVSRVAQTVRIGGLDLAVEFEEGESIRTELSHKYTRESVELLLASGGLALTRWLTDAPGDFALVLARRP